MTSTTSGLLDRALTVGGIGRTADGELTQVSRAIYATQYGKACAWKAATLSSASRTFTPEQVAQYALWLVEQGYARATAGLAVRAIRWGHRVAGRPVPDGLPASYVLRGADPTADRAVDVNDLMAPARRDPSELLTAFTSVCEPGTPRGVRNLVLINSLYGTGLPVGRLVELNLGDVMVRRADRSSPTSDFVYSLPVDDDRTSFRDLKHLLDPEHYATLCGACSMGNWLDLLGWGPVAQDTRPLFRSVDKAGVINGTAESFCGPATAVDGRLHHRSVTSRILRPLAATAGLLDVLRSPVRALRLAGACAGYVRGEFDLDETARRAGYTPGSALLLRHLLDLTGPVT
jgi:hypothetical protein